MKRRAGQRYNDLKCNRYRIRHRQRLSFVCAFCSESIGPNSIIQGSFNAAKYLDFLINYVKPFGDQIYGAGNYSLLHDNSPIHTATIVRDYLRTEFHERVHDHPPFSPDLNPIEHLGNHLKFLLSKYLTVESSEHRLGLRETIFAIWSELGDNSLLLSNFARSMHRRYAAVVDADGSATKY